MVVLLIGFNPSGLFGYKEISFINPMVNNPLFFPMIFSEEVMMKSKVLWLQSLYGKDLVNTNPY
jgi:hypothetical protein